MKIAKKKSIVLTICGLLLAGVLSAGLIYAQFTRQAPSERAVLSETTDDNPSTIDSPLEPVAARATASNGQTTDEDVADAAQMAFIEDDVDARTLESRVDFEMMNPPLTLENDAPAQLVEHVSEVDWDAARTHPALEPERLSHNQRDQLVSAAIPVLLPADDQLRDSGEVTVGDLWYSSSMATQDDGVYVTIHGQLKTLIAPGASAQSSDSTDFPQHIDEDLVTAIEGGLEINFQAFGAHYNITVECFEWRTDPHCRDSGFILQFVESLLMAGGGNHQRP